VDTLIYGPDGFSGTSAACPHVVGAAALVRGAYPSYSAAQVQSFLEGRAIDAGAGGYDYEYGSGRLSLGAPPTSISVDFTWTPSSPSIGQSVQFTISGVADLQSATWNFGGSGCTADYPQVATCTPGIYTNCMTRPTATPRADPSVSLRCESTARTTGRGQEPAASSGSQRRGCLRLSRARPASAPTASGSFSVDYRLQLQPMALWIHITAGSSGTGDG
jgi:hypothetical protein